MKQILLFFILLLGCTQEQPSIPETTIPIHETTPEEIEIIPEEDPGCYYTNSCNSDSYCLNNECVLKSSLIQKSSNESIITLVFIQSGMENESEFIEFMESETAAFVSATPFKDCPDKLRIVRLFDFCCDGIIDDCVEEKIGDFDAVIMLHHNGIYNKNCTKYYGNRSIRLSVESRGLLTHELGHELFGLWDQYCYWPSENNPNQVDFEEGNCTEVTNEDSWHYGYCSLSPDIENVTPYRCLGNLNSKGGRSIMGSTSEYTNPANPGFGFTDEELEIISEKIKCE